MPRSNLPIFALALALPALSAPGCKKPPATQSTAPTTTASPSPTPTDADAPAPDGSAGEPPAAEPAAPDNSAVLSGLDGLDAAIEGCKGKLGTKTAGECSSAITDAVAALAEPVAASAMAGDLQVGQDQLVAHAEKLASAVAAKKHKEQHPHLDALSKTSKEMRAKLAAS